MLLNWNVGKPITSHKSPPKSILRTKKAVKSSDTYYDSPTGMCWKCSEWTNYTGTTPTVVQMRTASTFPLVWDTPFSERKTTKTQTTILAIHSRRSTLALSLLRSLNNLHKWPNFLYRFFVHASCHIQVLQYMCDGNVLVPRHNHCLGCPCVAERSWLLVHRLSAGGSRDISRDANQPFQGSS